MKYCMCLMLALMCLTSAVWGQKDPLPDDSDGLAVPSANPPIQKQLEELNRDFTYDKRLINPLAIHDMMEALGNPRDPGPVALLVSGTQADRSKYYTKYSSDEMKKNAQVDLSGDRGVKGLPYFGYTHKGRLANGLHVLRTYESGGGTLVSHSLLLVEAAIEYEYGLDGKRRETLVIKRRGEFYLGDRPMTKVQLVAKDNTIIMVSDNGEPEERIQLK